MTDNKPRQIKALYDTVRPPREVTDKRIRGQVGGMMNEKTDKHEVLWIPLQIGSVFSSFVVWIRIHTGNKRIN